MRRYGWFALALAMTLLIAACGVDDPEGPVDEVDETEATPGGEAEGDETEGAGEATDRPGEVDHLTVALSTLGNEALDPMISPGENEPYLRLLFDPLIGLDRTSEEVSLEAGILEDWDLSDDGMTMTLYVTEGIEFHDGSPVTAEDVQYSLQRHFEDEAASANVGIIQDALGDPENVVLIDDNTVELQLAQHGASLESLLPWGSAETMVVPKDYIESVGLEEFRQNPIGSGPYKFVSQSPGSGIELERVEDHYAMGTPFAERVSILLVPEETTRAAMLQTGEADLIDAGVELAAELEDEGFHFNTKGLADPLAVHFPTLHRGVPPLDDVRVREALLIGANWEAIHEGLFFGLGERNISGMSRGSFGFEDRGALEYDPDRASELLEEAGFEEGFPITLEAFPKPGWAMLSVAEAVASDWNALGLETTISYRDFGSYRADWTGRSDSLADATATLHPYSGRVNFFGLFNAWGDLFAVLDEPGEETYHGEITATARNAESQEEFERGLTEMDEWLNENYYVTGVLQLGTPLMTNDNIGVWEVGRTAHSLNLRGFLWED